jgi:HD-like signal output (HDOD) protein
MAAPVLGEFARKQDDKGAAGRLDELTASADAAGAWGLVECLAQLRGKAENALWPEFIDAIDGLDFAGRLIFCHLHPGLVPEEFLSPDESNAKEAAVARTLWFDAPSQNRCPVITWPQLERQLDALAGCPVIDSVAAAFRMAATGQPSSLMPLMDQAEKDPGLAAQLLIAANHVRRHEESDMEPVENPRLSIGLLGEIRLGSLARGFVTVEERHMNLPPCTWPHFWMFQIGVARMARYTCGYLEFHNLEARAYTAGLLHDLGRLLLLHLHPHGFAAVLDYARQHALPLRAAEEKFLGCTTQEMAAHFAAKHGLPKSYCQVMRWIENPAQAGEDAELVAIVSLARDLCLQNHVGYNGDTPKKHGLSLGDTPEWRILSRGAFQSFDLRKFEAEAHAECRELRQELHGRLRLVHA